jgi:aminomethyltransferase
MCHPDGGIVDDLIAYKMSDEEIFICVNASNRAKDVAFMRTHAGEGATISDESEAWAQLALQGPLAERMLDPLTEFDLGAMGYYHFAMAAVAGVRCMVARTGYTGEDGFEVYIPVERANDVFDAIVAAGASDLTMCGLGCRDTLRLEAKFPLYGNDLSDETNPLEAGLSWVVKLDKAEPFVGSEAIRRIKNEGVRRRLRGFILNGRGVPRPHYPIFDGEVQVGELTSGTWSPTLEVGIAMGYVNVGSLSSESIEVGIRKRRVSADLTRKPFYKWT